MVRRGGGNIGGSLVLDAEGLVKLAGGDPRAIYPFEAIRRRRGHVVTAATILTEVLRGTPRDAPINRILNKVEVVSIDLQRARNAGALLGKAGLSGHRCALDAILAEVALTLARPVVVLTSDAADMAKLTEEPHRQKSDRITLVRI